MAADIFNVEGKKVATQVDFFSAIINKQVNKILYMPGQLMATKECRKFEGISFSEISFKSTTIDSFKFINCSFSKCLFLSTKFRKCEFSACSFEDCNFLGSTWENSRVDPNTLKNNFDYKKDANIGVKFFQHLYQQYSKDYQPEYKRDAKYLFLKSRHGLTYFHFKEKRIGKIRHGINIVFSTIKDLSSGYGVYRSRIVGTLLLYLFVISIINFCLPGTFTSMDKQPLGFFESMYFTFVMITTIGFGDVTPQTLFGQMAVIIESGVGIFLIAYTLNIFTGSDK